MVQLEKAGVPTVSLTARHFERDARTSGAVMGLAAIPLAIVDETFTSHSDTQIRAMVDTAIDTIEKSLTTAPLEVPPKEAAHVEHESFEGDDLLDCVERFNCTAIERGWS